MPWPELAAFAPVHAHKSRHECVLLPFEALYQAALSGIYSAALYRYAVSHETPPAFREAGLAQAFLPKAR